jgi:hypothetical protein
MGTEHGCDAVSASGAHGARFYRFQDSSGRVHLVDSIDSVPTALRSHAACIEYPAEATGLASSLSHGSSALGGSSAYQTFGLGFGAALVVAFVFSRLPGTLRLVLRLAIMGGVVALLAGAYFGWVRRTTQQSDSLLASPGALIGDAKRAVEQMNASMRAQQAELKEIEQAK